RLSRVSVHASGVSESGISDRCDSIADARCVRARRQAGFHRHRFQLREPGESPAMRSVAGVQLSPAPPGSLAALEICRGCLTCGVATTRYTCSTREGDACGVLAAEDGAGNVFV